MTRRSVLACAFALSITVGIQLSLVVAIVPSTTGEIPVTGAYSSDIDASTVNSQEAGALDLKLSEIGPATEDSTTDETQVDTITDSYEDLQHDPTLGDDDPVNNTLALDNSPSSLAADRVNITIWYTENDTSFGTTGNPDDTASTINILEFVYDGVDLVGTEITDENDNGLIDLADLTLNDTRSNLSSLSGIGTDGAVTLTLSLSGDRGLTDNIGGGDGLDILLEIRIHTSSFVDRDSSVNNTIRYAT